MRPSRSRSITSRSPVPARRGEALRRSPCDAPGNVCFRFARRRGGGARGVRPRRAYQRSSSSTTALRRRHRAARGGWRAGAGELTLYAATQVPHHVRRHVTEQLGLPRRRRCAWCRPMSAAASATRASTIPRRPSSPGRRGGCGRPVKWIASRNESFLSDTQARDHATHAELALDARRPFPRLARRRPSPISAPMSRPSAPRSRAPSTARCSPACTARPRSTSKSPASSPTRVPTDAYRGAGRPEACYVLERLADRAARELGIDRAEIRRRNLIPKTAMPYKTPIGPTYDCGDFPKIFGQALIADYVSFSQRASASPKRGRCAASASPAISNPRASRLRASPA